MPTMSFQIVHPNPGTPSASTGNLWIISHLAFHLQPGMYSKVGLCRTTSRGHEPHWHLRLGNTVHPSSHVWTPWATRLPVPCCSTLLLHSGFLLQFPISLKPVLLPHACVCGSLRTSWEMQVSEALETLQGGPEAWPFAPSEQQSSSSSTFSGWENQPGWSNKNWYYY